MIRLRGELDAKNRAMAHLAIHKHALARILPEWRTILIYVNMPDEVATTPLLLKLIEQGKRMCVPAFDRSSSHYEASELKNFGTDLESGRFGILEPKKEARRPVALEELDAVFLPGLAFDRRGNRLGYGHGYFDRIVRGARAFKIGLAYRFQIIDRIETTPWDVPVNMIITEKEAIQCLKP